MEREESLRNLLTITHTPQRFVFRPRKTNELHFGFCCRRYSGSWQIVLDEGASATFDEDPWEVMGQVVGDVSEFVWIDNENNWHGFEGDSQ